jgi:AAA+ ATPase superfamily predicted ATPase
VAKRGYVQREFRLALDTLEEMPPDAIYTIPIRLDDCEIPEQFHHLQWSDISEEGEFDRIVRAMQFGMEQRQHFTPEPALEPPPVRPTQEIEIAEKFFSQAGIKGIELLPNGILHLRSEEGLLCGIAIFWQEERIDIFERLVSTRDKHDQNLLSETKLYVIYIGKGPSGGPLQALRGELRCEIIPLLLPMLEKALLTNECKQVLEELEDLYLTRVDPYAEFKPIRDPTWFYGRDSFLNRLPAMLAQGTHVGIFGLRKVGKTSLINQLRQRFLKTPTVFIDCQEFPAQASIYFEEILIQLRAELHSQGIKGLPQLPIGTIIEVSFRRHFLELFAVWRQSGRHDPFLIILDEIDKFFPRRELIESVDILSEYVRFFRTLRGMAQSRQCLVTLVIAYRPEINRHNSLNAAVGENPMFYFFQEEHLGFLNAADSAAMVREIGLWKQIFWEPDAAQRVFHYCGGHPFVTRFFASHACKRGSLKTIDYERVEETAKEIQSTLSRHEIGSYYREGIWGLLREDEKQVLRLILQHNKNGILEEELPSELEEALINLECLGLVASNNKNISLSAYLFYTWLQRRVGI